jgi:tetratricopeptide (TPR) repeat protein
MKAESIVYAIAGMCFGIILGWIIATQQQPARAVVPVTQVASDTPQQSQSASASGQQAKVLDEARVQQLTTILNSDPKNAGAAVQLGNTYFDAERYPEAINWYEKALAIDPKNADASTDLGVSYYYTNQPDKALAQFDRSLKIDANHAKTLLNVGIVRAFGKQDLAGATKAWEQVIALDPNGPEGQAAKRALDTLKSAHGAAGGPKPGA